MLVALQITFLVVLLPSGCSSPGLAQEVGMAISCLLRSLFSEVGDGAAMMQSPKVVGWVLVATVGTSTPSLLHQQWCFCVRLVL